MITTIKIFIVLLIIWKIVWYISYYFSTISDNIHYAKMKWSMIKQLYPINPEKWTYDDKFYDTRYHTNNWKMMNNLRYSGTPIMLSFIDYQKLRYFVNRHGKTYNTNALAVILEDVQKDIEIRKQQAQREINEAQEMMARIARNAGGRKIK